MKYYLNVCLLAGFFATSFAHVASANRFADKLISTWVGAPVDEAISQWGFPDDEKTIAGKKVFIWLDHEGGLGALANCERLLVVNAKNIIVQTQSRGNNCPFVEAFHYKNWRRKP